jgi:hypothetical protein
MPRITLGQVMAAVVVVAANLALARALAGHDPDTFVILAVPTLALGVGAWRAWRDRRPGRRFWLGFLLAGLVVTGSLARGLTHPARYAPGAGGLPMQVDRGSWHYRLWEPYIEALFNIMEWAQGRLGGAVPDIVGLAALMGAIWAMLLLPALLGGLAGRWLGRGRRAGPGEEAR